MNASWKTIVFIRLAFINIWILIFSILAKVATTQVITVINSMGYIEYKNTKQNSIKPTILFK